MSEIISPSLLAILRCPETKQTLRLADESELAAAAKKSPAPLDGGLVRADGKRLYPIRDGFPILLIDEAIELKLEE